ncbi:MAG: PIG-L family deacetylase [bacterium]
MTQKINVLTFGPHPDDSEIGTGAVLLKLKALGYTTGIIDLTEGEMGTGGDAAIRAAECDEAARILKVDIRENLNLGDCRLEDNFENRCKVAAVIRKYRPDVILAPYWDLPPGRGLGHTDHIVAGHLVSHGNNFAHLRKLDIEGQPHYAPSTFYYFLPPDFKPSFIVDITEYVEDWLASIFAHKSQFGDPEQNWQIRDFFESRVRTWGRFAGATYAMAFYSPWPLRIDNMMSVLGGIRPPMER